MFDNYDWISEDPTSYDFSSGSTEFYSPEYEPEPNFQYSPSYGLNYDGLSLQDYLPSQPELIDYSPSFESSGMDLSSFMPASFDVSGAQPYSFSDVLPGSELITQDFGGDFAADSVSDPYLRAAMSEVGNTNYGFDPSAQIAAQSGEAINLGGGMYDYNGQYVDATGLAQAMGSGITPGSGNLGFKGQIVHDLGGGLGVQSDSANGLRTGYMDDQGMLGFGNKGSGALIPGAPSQALSREDIAILGDPGTLDAWAENQDLSWADYARQNNYDPYDIGTDLRWSLGNALPAAGYGGIGGKGVGSNLTPKVLDALIKSGGTSAGQGSSTGGSSQKPKYNEQGNTETSQAARNVGATAAMLAALWGKGDKKSPKSSQGDINTNAWDVARMKNRGVYTPMADGGSVLAKIKELYEQYGPGANRTERPRGPDRVDPRHLIVDDGMVQNASRAMTGRQRQLDELERQAVQGMAGGGRLVKHPSGGQADKVPIAASGGEYVFDADSVAALGDGNTDAGAAVLDEMRQNLRRHKRSAPPSKIPPKAKSPLEYMKGR